MTLSLRSSLGLCVVYALLGAGPVHAVVRNVGSGQTYSTIQQAVTAAGAGDEIHIHNGNYNECVVLNASGTQQNPIVITAASGQNPVINSTCSAGVETGAIRIQNRSDWTIDGTLRGGTLTFDGGTHPTTNPLWAIYVYAQATDVYRIIIRNLTIRDWATTTSYSSGAGMGGIILRGNSSATQNWEVFDSVVSGVEITNTAMGIGAFSTPSIILEDNIIHDMRCGNHGNNEVGSWSIKVGLGAHRSNLGTNGRIRRNHIYNIPGCSHNSACIYCDVGDTGWIWEYNYCHDSLEGNASAAFKGLFVEANCANHIVRYNVVANVGEYGLQTRDAADPNTTANAAKFYRNTIYNASGATMYLRNGSDEHNHCTGGACVYLEGNLFVQTRTGTRFYDVFQANVEATYAEWDTNWNWYFHSGTSATPFRMEQNPSANWTFTQWQTNCNCDQNTTFGSNPNFAATTGTIPGDFLNLNTGSPAIDACGTNAALGPYLGNGHDCGAFEAPLFRSAATTSSATTIVVTYDSIHGALTDCTANRFSVDASITGNNLVPTAVSVAGNQATLTMGTTLVGNDVLTIDGQRNACRTVFIPNTPMAVGSAAFTNRPVTNNISGGGGGGGVFGTWVSGPTHADPAGTNRLLLLGFCWSQQVSSPPMAITSPAYGGQACTIIDSQLTAVGNAQTLAVLAYCDEAEIAAATSDTITYTTSETPSSTRQPIVASAFYANITQVGPITDSDNASVEDLAAGVSISTPALITTNPGVAVALGCANGAPPVWTAGSGWEEQLDICEDSSCSHRILAQDRDTTGTDVTPDASLSAASARVSMVAASLNGGEGGGQNPEDLILEQVAYRGHEWRAEASPTSLYWLEPENAPLTVVPDGKFSLVLSYQVTQESETVATAKALLCSDNGGEPYLVSTSHGSHALAIIASPVWTDQDPIPTRLLSVPASGDTFVAGVRHGSDAQVANQLPTLNDYSEREFSLWLSPTATPGTSTCQLAHADGTALSCTNSAACPATITVVLGRALGF